MAITPAADSATGTVDSGHRALRRGVVLVLALVGVVVAALMATAASPAPTLTAVTPDAAYTSLTVTLSEELRATGTTTGLATGAFELRVTGGATTVPTVARTNGTTYVLTSTAAVAAGTTSVVVPAGKAVTTDGTAVPELTRVVPLTATDAKRAIAALSTVEVDGKPFGPLPFVGSWFASLRPVSTTAGAAGAASLQAAAGDAATGDGRSVGQEVASTPLALTDLVSGLGAALTSAAGMDTQAAMVTALEAVPGVRSVVLGSTGLRLAFEPTESAGRHSSDQLTEVSALPYSLDGTTTFALHLGGTVDITLPSGGAAAHLQAVDLTMEPRSFSLPATGTVGMVAVTTDAEVVSSLSLGVDCTAGCAATPTVSAAGTLAVEVGTVVFADAEGTEQVDVESSGRPVRAVWSPGSWDFTGLAGLTEEESSTAKALLAPLAPVVSDRAGWDAAELPQFDQLDGRSVTLALEWVGNWLRSTDAVEALGTQLPAVGLSVGDVLQLSDQVGSRVTRLVEALEPDGTSVLRTADPTAQDVLRALCDEDLLDCDGGLQGLDIETGQITYDVELDVCQVLFGDEGTCTAPRGVPVEQAGPAIDLAGGDAFNGDLGDLGGIRTTLRTGTWQGRASATLAFRLSLDLRPDATVMGTTITPADFPGPGFPDTDRLAPGDLCRGLALQLGTTETTFAGANGVLVDGSPTLACDTLAWDADGSSAEVVVPAEAPAVARTVQVTALDVCAAAALKHGLQVDVFLALNAFDATACAARARLQVTSALPPVPTADGESSAYVVDAGDGAAFTYYRAPADEPLPVSFRLAIEDLGDEPFVRADVDVTGSDLTGEVALGFLDLDLTGSITAAPSVEVTLPEDGRLTLVELAEAADAETPTVTIGALLGTALSGDLDVDLELANDLAFPDGPAGFRLHGDPADLTATGGVDTSDDCSDLGDDTPVLCYELGDWPGVSELLPAQAQRMVTGLLDRVAGLTSAGDASFELPMVGVSMPDLVGLGGTLHDVVGAVETREPQDLSALQAALDAGLTAAGLPGGTLVAAVEDEVLTLQVPLGVEEEATYPFGFDVGVDDGGELEVRISPADGGARLAASGEAVYAPTLGIDLSGPVTDDLDSAIFLVAAGEEDDLQLTGTIGSGDDKAPLRGDVVFGSLNSDADGGASADPSLTLAFTELADEDDRVTLARLGELLDPEVETALPDGFLAWDGAMSLDVSIEGLASEFDLSWNAEVPDLVDGEFGTFTELPDLESLGLKLDLETLVRGTSQTTRFIGRALAESDALSTSLPLVGDQLAALSAVGDDLQLFATSVDDLYAFVKDNDEEFVEGINETLAEEVCGALEEAGNCRAELLLFQDGEQQEEPDVTEATGVELQLQLEMEESLVLGTPKLLDVPGFEVDTAADLTLRAGYRLGLTLGVDLQDGFYVKGFDVGTEDEPDLTRLIELYGRASIGGVGEQAVQAGGAVKIGGVTAFTLNGLDMSLGGSFGPQDDGAGFALDMPEPLTLMDVVNGRRSIDEIFEPKISVIVESEIVIGTPSDDSGSIPSLAFPVYFDWTMEGVIGGGLELESPSLSIGSQDPGREYVTIDVTSLVNDVVKPALLELNEYNPVAQAASVKDALNSQVPVLDKSVRGLLDGALGGDPRWQLLSFLLDLDDVATSLKADPSTAPALIPLGGYTVLPREDAGYFSPPGDGTVWDDPALRLIKDLVTNLSASAGGAKSFAKPTPVRPAPPGQWDGDLGSSSTTSVATTVPKRAALKPVVSMPILDNPLSAATLLFGGEVEPVSFIEIAPPAVDFGMSVKFSRTLFDLNLGAIEARLSVGLKGAVGVTLRVGIGYSSHGLTTGDPINGLYLVDAYDGNRALPMVALGGRVSVRVDGRFAVVGIAEAVFSGSGYVRLEGGLDLFDESLVIPESGRGDGMFHVDEMLRVVDGHRIGATKDPIADAFCIFRPTVQLQAGLAFSATAKLLGIEVWSGSFAEDWNLVDEEYSCAYVERVAQLVDRTVVLGAGTAADDRLDEEGDIAEGFRISQDATTVTVSGAGPFTGFRPMSFPLDGVDEVFADLGAEADTVLVDADVTVPVTLYGGAGNDVLEGGAGDDVLDGGEGVDTITPRGGDDEVVIGSDGAGATTDRTLGDGVGCTGCNVVVLGGGNDTVQGGPAPVVYRTAAGDFGQARIEHEGPTMVVDLGASSAEVDAVVDALGLHVTSTQGAIDTADPSTLARFVGSAGDDRIRVADGPLGMYVDGGEGADTVTVATNGDDRTARVHDSGTGACTTDECDRLVVKGTTAADRFLLRAHVEGQQVTGPDSGSAAVVPATEGVVAVLSPESGTDSGDAAGAPTPSDPTKPAKAFAYTGRADATQLVLYDPSVEALHVEGVAGADEFALDDVATTTTVEGGRAVPGGAGSSYQVGQVFGWETDVLTAAVPGGRAAFRTPTSPDSPITPWGEGQFRYRESIRGWLSYGISHPTTVIGGEGDDAFTVYSNRSDLDLQGGDGDDVFTLRSFIANGSITAAGDDGDDTFKYDFEYVANDDVAIDGGGGANTFVAIGTELQDGFAVSQQGVSVCVPKGNAPGVSTLDPRVRALPGINALPVPRDATAAAAATGTCSIGSSVTNVQRYVLHGLQGNDVFWVKGTPAGSETFVIGGADGSTYLLGDQGDLSAVDGRVEVVADLRNLSPAAEAALRMVELAFPLPVLLDGDVTYSAVDALLPGDAVDKTAKHTAVVDGSAMTAQTGRLAPDPATPTAGISVTGLSTGGLALGGLDTVRVVLGRGADVLDVEGTLSPYVLPAEGVLDASTRLGRTELYAGDGADQLQVDAVNGPTWVALEAGADTLRAGTGTAAGIRFPLEVYGGSGTDDVEVDAGLSATAVRADLDLVRAVPATWSGRAAPLDMAVLSELGMPSVVRHDADVDVFRVRTGLAADVVNVRGSIAGRTELRTAAGEDRVFVSAAAEQVPGAPVPGLLGGSLADVGALDVDAGSQANLLMISDRDSGTARTVTMAGTVPVGSDTATVGMRAASFAVTGGASVAFDATGGTFAQGVTAWLGDQDDAVTVTGVRRDGTDLAVMAWEGRETSPATVRTLTTLNTGAGDDTVTAALPVTAGLLVANLEQGDDALLGAASARGVVAFGGDGADRLETGSGDDLVFGDFGRVEYGPASGVVGVLGVPDRMDLVTRVAQAPRLVASCTSQPTVVDGAVDCAAITPVTSPRAFAGIAATVGNVVSVGAGDDVAFGGGGSDWLQALDGRNALVSDHGSVVRVLPAALGGARRIQTSDGSLDVPVLEEPFAYDVLVRDDLMGAADVVLGGAARDWVFAGLGDDLVNAQAGSDLVLGGDGSDVLWGGTGDDRVYAGFGDDQVDLKLMPAGTGTKAGTTAGWPVGTWWKGAPLLRPQAWKPFAPVEDTDTVAGTVNGSDVVFGGDGPDAMQADVGGAGRVPGDRLLDWYGAYNVYYVCSGAYGAGYVLRVPSPSTVSALEQLARADGAAGPAGTRQLAIPVSGNRSPTHPAHPGNNHGC